MALGCARLSKSNCNARAPWVACWVELAVCVALLSVKLGDTPGCHNVLASSKSSIMPLDATAVQLPSEQGGGVRATVSARVHAHKREAQTVNAVSSPKGFPRQGMQEHKAINMAAQIDVSMQPALYRSA